MFILAIYTPFYLDFLVFNNAAVFLISKMYCTADLVWSGQSGAKDRTTRLVMSKSASIQTNKSYCEKRADD
jgi:hypothetical protein